MSSLPKKLLIITIGALCVLTSLRTYLWREPLLELWMLDVGQGESVLVREPSGKFLLYDGGPDDTVLSEIGQLLPPWLKYLDLVVVSHNHIDHIRGLIAIMNRYRIGEVWLSGSLYDSADATALTETITQRHIKTRVNFFKRDPCSSPCPLPLPFGQTQIQVYHPVDNQEENKPKDAHEATLSIKISYRENSVFLTGDLNERQEASMLKACQAPTCSLKAKVLQIPHHGSRSGLSPAFLAAIDPAIALIPVGIINSYGHPAPEILQKLEKSSVRTYRTDTQGQLHIEFKDSSIGVTTHKTAEPP